MYFNTLWQRASWRVRNRFLTKSSSFWRTGFQLISMEMVKKGSATLGANKFPNSGAHARGAPYGQENLVFYWSKKFWFWHNRAYDVRPYLRCTPTPLCKPGWHFGFQAPALIFMSTLTWMTKKKLEREIKNIGDQFVWKKNMKFFSGG